MATSVSCGRAQAPSDTRRARVAMPAGGRASVRDSAHVRPTVASWPAPKVEKAGCHVFKQHTLHARSRRRTHAPAPFPVPSPPRRAHRSHRPSLSTHVRRRRRRTPASRQDGPPRGNPPREENLGARHPARPRQRRRRGLRSRRRLRLRYASPPPRAPRRRTIPHPRTPHGPVAIHAIFQNVPDRSRPPGVKARHRRDSSTIIRDARPLTQPYAAAFTVPRSHPRAR